MSTQHPVPVQPIMAGVVPTGLTVAEAIANYKARSAESSSVLRQAISYMIDNNIRTDFANDSYSDALVLTEMMLSRTNKSLRVLSGDGEGGFFYILNTFLSDAITRIAQNDGCAHFILIAKTIPKYLLDLQAMYPHKFSVKLAGTDTPIRHFIVSDTKMARVEEPHKALRENSKSNEIKARVYFNEPTVSSFLEKQFDSMWAIVSNYEVNKA